MLMLGNLGIALLIATGFHLLNILFAHLFVHDPQMRRQRVLRFGVIFSNAGYMSLPLQDAILGADGVFYGAAVIRSICLRGRTDLCAYGGDIKLMLAQSVLNPAQQERQLVLSFSSCRCTPGNKRADADMAALNATLLMLMWLRQSPDCSCID